MGDVDRKTYQDADVLRAITEWQHRPAWRTFAREKALVALTVALLLPSPLGYWAPLTVILWGLVGDPRSRSEAAASAFGGAALIALYTAAIFVALTGLQWALSRVMQAMAASNKRAISNLTRTNK